jgi:lysophosphatidylcholine acyltransferase / lyso-PAF acetyltransferase
MPPLSTPLLSDSIAPVNGNRHEAPSACDPFAFLSEDRPPLDRGLSPADPFRNATPAACTRG